jgi:thioredoxin reductase/Fe-S-cluster-containing hydrogenase component 2
MKRCELIIIGAGPAGLSAAIEAASNGMQAVVFDENERPGGQLFKQIHKFFGSKEHQAKERGFRIGEKLLKEARDLGVEVKLKAAVMGIFDDKEISVTLDGRVEHYRANDIIIATGASEKMLPFPGWTLPGVIGAGAAQTMMNLHGLKPGSRVLMVGSGNVGLVVGYQLLQAGCQLEGVIDAAPRIGGYGVHAAKLARTGVPFHMSHTIKEAHGDTCVKGAVISAVDSSWQPIPGSDKFLEVDTICIAVGLSPMSQLAQTAHCHMENNPPKGGLVSICNKYGETTTPGVYAVGDVAGIEEASSAMIQGKIAGAAVSFAKGYISDAVFAARYEEYHNSLMDLREGMFGHDRGAPDPEHTEEGHPLSLSLLTKGYMEAEEILDYPGAYPSEYRNKGVSPVIECTQNIPCNPCQDACKRGCIKVSGKITSLPSVDATVECTACGMCVASCPGQAIFLVDETLAPGYASVAIPYEFNPLPEPGSKGLALDRSGSILGEAEVIKVQSSKAMDETAVLTMKIPVEWSMQARFFKVN